MSHSRFLARGVGLLTLLALPGIVAAPPTGGGTELGLGVRIGIRFLVTLVVNLLLGGTLLLLSPEYAGARVGEIHVAPGESFLWGLGVGIGVPIVLVILALTIVGLIVAIPGLVILAIVSIIGSAVTVLWIGDMLVGAHGDIGVTHVGLGAVILAIVGAIPVLGSLLTTVAGLFGIGVVGRALYRSHRKSSHQASPATTNAP